MDREREPIEYEADEILPEGYGTEVGEISVSKNPINVSEKEAVEGLERDIFFGRRVARLIKSPTARRYIVGTVAVGLGAVIGYEIGEYLGKKNVWSRRLFKEGDVDREIHLNIDIDKKEFDPKTRKIIKMSAIPKYAKYFRSNPQSLDRLEELNRRAEEEEKHARFLGALGTLVVVVGDERITALGDDLTKLIDYGRRTLAELQQKSKVKSRRFTLFGR